MMKTLLIACIIGAVFTAFTESQSLPLQSSVEHPKTWVDGLTGHRITRLTREPGSRTVYFNSNPFVPGTNEMIYAANRGVSAVSLDGMRSHVIVQGPVTTVVLSGVKPELYFTRPHDMGVYRADISSGELRRVGTLPIENAKLSSINADGTLLAGLYVEAEAEHTPQVMPDQRASKKSRERVRFDAHPPTVLFTISLPNGETKEILHTNNWLNHVQFSPRDPQLLMYCHEGPWAEVDRIWTIHADGSHNRSLHQRTLDMASETAGHEFWDKDGETVWYDLQMPKGVAFYLASVNTRTGEQRRYQMNRSQWSIHFNGSTTTDQFCGDGASWFGAASSSEGQWIQLYKPTLEAVLNGVSRGGPYRGGALDSERLVDMSKQDYTDEPNPHITPDGKAVVFTSNMLGQNFIFSVAIKREPGVKPSASMKQSFDPRLDMASAEKNVAHVALRVLGDHNEPVAGARVEVKSLDTGRPLTSYVTNTAGTVPAVILDKDLHRFTVTTSDGSQYIYEQITAPFTTSLILRPEQKVAAADVQSDFRKHLLVKSADGWPMGLKEVLVRNRKGSRERWYQTNAAGEVELQLQDDPSTLVIVSNWKAERFTFSKTCPSRTGFAIAEDCINISGSTEIRLGVTK